MAKVYLAKYIFLGRVGPCESSRVKMAFPPGDSFLWHFGNILDSICIPWSLERDLTGWPCLCREQNCSLISFFKKEKEGEPSDYNFPPSGWEGRGKYNLQGWAGGPGWKLWEENQGRRWREWKIGAMKRMKWENILRERCTQWVWTPIKGKGWLRYLFFFFCGMRIQNNKWRDHE